MYTIDELFNYRDVVGCKLEQIISARDYTKSGVCAGAGISRPTLDKMLGGEVTSKTNFEKHTVKLLAFLGLTPSEFMGSVDNPCANQKQLRKALNVDLARLSQMSGVSIEELKRIEAGENAPLVELRDIAFCLGTGVRGVLGDGYFQTQLAHMNYFVDSDPTTIRSPGGFWGHVGVLVKGYPEFMWFPITEYTSRIIRQSEQAECMAIPCMDNSLLLLPCGHIEELILLDEACDPPADVDWDCNVSCGEVPAVMYEAFDDYASYKHANAESSKYDLSESLATAIDELVANLNLDPETFEHELHSATIMFTNGRTLEHGIYCGDYGNLTSEIKFISETGDFWGEGLVTFQDENEAEIRINLKNVSMMKLPLALIDSVIAQEFAEMIAEQEN